jgi:OB-fold nucleic acid binding domain
MRRNRFYAIEGVTRIMLVLMFGALRSISTPTTVVRAFTAASPFSWVSTKLAVVSLRGKQSCVRYVSPKWDHCNAGRVQSALCSTLSSSEIDELNARIKMKGDEIRELKESGIEKSALAPHIEELKRLKSRLPVEASPIIEKNEKPMQVTDTVIGSTEKSKGSIPSNVKKVDEMSESELRLNRINKIDDMRNSGVEPYEYTYHITHTAVQLGKEYEGDRLQSGEEDENADVAVAGRIMTRRVFGKLAFFTLQDATGLIQLQFDKGRLNESFQVRVTLFPPFIFVSFQCSLF